MRRYKAGIVMLMLLLLGGCQNVPDTVREKAENYTRSERVQQSDIQKVNIEQLLDDEKKVLAGEYQNLELMDTIHLEKPDTISVLKLRLYDNLATKENASKMAAVFFGSHKYDTKIKDYSDEKWAIGKEYGFSVNNNSKDNGYLRNSGAYFFVQAGQTMFISDTSQIYHIDLGDEPGVCDINGKSLSVGKAVEFVNQWCNEHWRAFEEDYTYRVKTVYKCNDTIQDYLFFEVCKYYRGVPFDDIRFFDKNGDSYINNILEITMRKEDTLSGLRNNNVCYHIINEQEHTEDLIGLQQAVKLVEQTMTGSQKQKIMDIDIKYEVKWIYDENLGGYVSDGAEFEARPVWSFIIDAPEYQNKDEQWARKFINVDMITGDVMYQNEVLGADAADEME